MVVQDILFESETDTQTHIRFLITMSRYSNANEFSTMLEQSHARL